MLTKLLTIIIPIKIATHFIQMCFSKLDNRIEQELLKITKMSEHQENKIGRNIAKEIAKEFKGKLDKNTKW